jgi:hypothetical protein
LASLGLQQTLNPIVDRKRVGNNKQTTLIHGQTTPA